MEQKKYFICFNLKINKYSYILHLHATIILEHNLYKKLISKVIKSHFFICCSHKKRLWELKHFFRERILVWIQYSKI